MTRRRMDPDDRRASILAVAGDLISESGARALTVEAVASRAGISAPLVYKYFDNREGLLLALYERALAEWSALAAERERDRLGEPHTTGVGAGDGTGDGDGTGGGFEAQLRRTLAGWLDQIESPRGAVLARLLGEPSLEREVEAMRHRIRSENVERWIVLCEAEGLDRDRSVAFSTFFNAAVEEAWVLIRSHGIDRTMVEHVFVTSVMSSLEALRPTRRPG